ncbi:flagellar type III secretion system protein FliR [Alginatibacterium sediminis]|uniref:Flagellar biosynthetic protein FliR n=1 Tax=Alginatibacterium sediminis TaxID=2164068 RepID=A0A420EFL7_9ALTE|nr:flagellar biosynthetic protein FliR [Alginatibacterium sediminis]RKF19492.1 flagellar type III secretion system protein FliR [Alginatibacterium sediminis]
MNLDSGLIMQWIGEYVWALARISGLMLSIAVYSGKTVPTRVRMLFSVAITFVVVPVLPPVTGIELFSLEAALVIAQQILIGAAAGFCTSLLLQTFVVAGQVIAMQTSLGFASMVDPINGQNTPVVGQIYLLLATLLFLAVDGHGQLITLVVMSFETIPVGLTGLSVVSYQSLAAWFSQIFFAALTMSISPIVAMLLVNFSFGVMTRAAPQLNIFSIGFAVGMLFGLLILWLTIGGFMVHFNTQWENSRQLACQILEVGC